MQPEAPALLWDARKAAGLVESFVSGRSWDDYESDSMLRSAVERQFQIIGEALNKLSRVDRETANAVPDLPRIVAFRNVLVHGYSVLDNGLIWEVATSRMGGNAPGKAVRWVTPRPSYLRLANSRNTVSGGVRPRVLSRLYIIIKTTIRRRVMHALSLCGELGATH